MWPRGRSCCGRGHYDQRIAGEHTRRRYSPRDQCGGGIMPLLDIRNLTIEVKTGENWVKAVDRVSLTLAEGEIRGLVGESGSGKSLIAKAICGVTKENWRVTADRMRFDDIDLLRLSARERRKLLGHNVSMIFREAAILSRSVGTRRQAVDAKYPPLDVERQLIATVWLA